MLFCTQTITNWQTDAEAIRRGRYGVIEICEGRLVAIHLRPFPKIVTILHAFIAARSTHRRRRGDRLWLYYNQPRRHNNFLAVAYAVSTRDSSLASMNAALRVLEGIAEQKQSDALLCDIANRRISDRLLARWGWQPHAPNRWHRNFIKRFYGDYSGSVLPEMA